jgi:Big-like domain-containing protein
MRANIEWPYPRQVNRPAQNIGFVSRFVRGSGGRTFCFRKLTLCLKVLLLVGTSLPASAATITWIGASNNLWSVAANWSGGVPVAGDSLVFPTAAANLNTINDLAAGTLFNSITINGGGGMPGTGSYTISGNTIALSGGIDVPSSGGVTLNAPIQLAAAQTFSFQGTVTLNSPINLNGFNLTINGYLPVNGVISGAGNLILLGGVSLFANNTYMGTTTIGPTPGFSSASINGAQPQSDVIVNGRLFGAGASVGNLTMNGLLAPGTSAPCCGPDNSAALFNTKNLIFSGSSFPSTALFIDINGSVPGTGYDQVRVAGTVTIGANTSLTLNLSPSFVPTAGQVFTLIDNDSTDPISGTFTSLPEGATVTLNGVYQFRVSYVGDDGNDFTVTSLSGVQPTTTSVSSSSNPAPAGGIIIFTIVVSGSDGVPTGTVTLMDGPTMLVTLSLINGAASYSTSSLAAGNHNITAIYSGDRSFGASTSPALIQVVVSLIPALDVRSLIALALALGALAAFQLRR